MTKDDPKKVLYKIGEVGKLADVPTHVLRYWESEFSCITPKRTRSGQRLYRPEDVSSVLQIKELLHLRGYTIAGAKKYLQEEETSSHPVTPTTQHPHNKKGSLFLSLLKQEIYDLKELLEK